MLLVHNKRLRLLAGVLKTANFAYLKLLLKNPQAARSFAGRIFRTYAELGSGVRYWRACGIDALLPPGRAYQINLQYGRYEVLSNPVDELAYLALLARATETTKIFEIGTFRGRTALTFALNTPDTAIIYTLDLPPDQHDVDGMIMPMRSSRHTQLRAPTTAPRPSSTVSASFTATAGLLTTLLISAQWTWFSSTADTIIASFAVTLVMR